MKYSDLPSYAIVEAYISYCEGTCQGCGCQTRYWVDAVKNASILERRCGYTCSEECKHNVKLRNAKNDLGEDNGQFQN